jgi:hypothetical protein
MIKLWFTYNLLQIIIIKANPQPKNIVRLSDKFQK